MVTRRQFTKLITSGGIAAIAPQIAAPVFAQQKPIRIGLLAARSGVAAAIGEISVRSAQWTVDRFNKEGALQVARSNWSSMKKHHPRTRSNDFADWYSRKRWIAYMD